MIVQPVILAGGSGTRLWPASRRAHPKQFLALIGAHSLLQETALRIPDFYDSVARPAGAGVLEGPHADAEPATRVLDPIVVTAEEYRFIVAAQLNDVGVGAARIVLEPAGRSTAPALTVAALVAGGGEHVDHDAPGVSPEDMVSDPLLLVMPSDHLIADPAAFRRAVGEGLAPAETGRIVTFGVVPDRPHTGYGYIRAGEPLPGLESGRLVAGFTEKPEPAAAERYLADGHYFWNSGIFMMRCSAWLMAVDRFHPDIGTACRGAVSTSRTEGTFVHLDPDKFLVSPSASVDYAVMERLAPAHAVVIPLDCGWADVGGWDALCAASSQDADGNVVEGDVVLQDTRRSLVHAGSRLVAVLGVDDMVVVDTPDALLVASRDKTADLTDVVTRVRDLDEAVANVHSRKHRPWGYFESVHVGRRFQVKHIVVAPGAALSLQLHRRRDEHWVVVRGVADIVRGDETFRLYENQSTYIPLGTTHRLANPGPEPLELIEVESGDYLGEDDIVRLEDRYGRYCDRPPSPD